jgi:hypothetical protein
MLESAEASKPGERNDEPGPLRTGMSTGMSALRRVLHRGSRANVRELPQAGMASPVRLPKPVDNPELRDILEIVRCPNNL